jgi:branched-chain amino acid transport system substrate-binding protein
MKRLALIVAALLAGASASRADDLVIGLATSQTGPYIANSQENVIATQMAVDRINAAGGVNGKKLRLSVFDTGGNAQQAQVAVRKFAEDDGALGIIGPFSSGEARVSFPAGERLRIPQISNSSSAPGITKGFTFAFRNTSDEDTEFDRLLAKMKELNILPKTAAIAYPADEFVSKTLGTKTFPELLKKYGVTIAGTIDFPMASFDLSPQIAQLEQTPHDAVAMSAPIETVVKFVREMRRQGDHARVIGSSLLSDPGLAEKLGTDGDGTLYPNYDYFDLNDATRAFNAEFGARAKAAGLTRMFANQTDASAYDIVSMYAYAMRVAKATGDKDKLADERVAIRDALEAMPPQQGVLGASHFSADHDARMTIYIMEIRNGTFNLLGTFPPE